MILVTRKHPGDNVETNVPSFCLHVSIAFCVVLSSWFLFPVSGITVLTAALLAILSPGVLYGMALVSGSCLCLATLTPLGDVQFTAALGTAQSLMHLFVITGAFVSRNGYSTSFLSRYPLDFHKFLRPLKYFLYVLASVMLLSSLNRSSSLLNLPWAGAAILYATRLSSGTGPFQRSHFTRNSLTILFVMAATVLMVETGSRLVLRRLPLPVDFFIPCDYDPDLVFKLRPGAHGTFMLKDNSGQVIHVEGRVSSQGIRDREFGPKAPDEFRIVLLGDSYAMGHGLKPEETFARKLETLLNKENLSRRVTVINCGTGGYAPWQERLFLQKYAFAFEPDLVLLQLFPPNDIAGCYNRNGQWLPVIHERWEKRVYEFSRQHELPFRADRWLKKHLVAYRLALYATGVEDPPVRRFLANTRFFCPINYPLFRSAYARPPLREACLRDWYPELQEAWQLFEDAIRGIKADCDSRTIAVAALVHGELISFEPAGWKNLKEAFPEVHYEEDKDILLTRRLLERIHIPQADLSSRFASYPNPEDLYFVNDGHFSPVGATIVAECLRDFFRDQSLLRER